MSFTGYKFCHFTGYGFKAEELGLADTMVAATVDEVDGAELAELDGLEALGVEYGFFYLLHIKVIFVTVQAHHHNQPVVAVIAWMGCALDVRNPYIGIVG